MLTSTPRRGGGIVLVALNVGLHVLRRHQPHLMTKLREFTRPIMGRGTGLRADKARWQRFEERQHLAAPQLLPNDDLFGRVNFCYRRLRLGDILKCSAGIKSIRPAPRERSARIITEPLRSPRFWGAPPPKLRV